MANGPLCTGIRGGEFLRDLFLLFWRIELKSFCCSHIFSTPRQPLESKENIFCKLQLKLFFLPILCVYVRVCVRKWGCVWFWRNPEVQEARPPSAFPWLQISPVILVIWIGSERGTIWAKVHPAFGSPLKTRANSTNGCETVSDSTMQKYMTILNLALKCRQSTASY